MAAVRADGAMLRAATVQACGVAPKPPCFTSATIAARS